MLQNHVSINYYKWQKSLINMDFGILACIIQLQAAALNCIHLAGYEVLPSRSVQ